MIIACFMLGTFATAGLAFVLFLRQRRAHAAVHQALAPGRGDRFLIALQACIQTALDETLPSSSLDDVGISHLDLGFREPIDPYETVLELLVYLATKGQPGSTLPADVCIKATYQIGYTLDIPLTLLHPCLALAIDEMKSAAGSSIVKIREVLPGELADAETMVPLVPGQRVVYPFGVIVYGQDNSVISRAKVLCG